MRDPGLSVIRDEVEQYQIANGMRVVLARVADTGSAGATLVIRAGASDEDAAQAGLAHLTEHLVFDGRPDGDTPLWHRLETLGAGAYNGVTSWDATRYVVFAPQQNLRDVLFALASVLRDPLAGVDDVDFVAERQIVKNETRLRLDDGSPGQALGWLMEATFPPRHPYARPGVGKPETLDRITLADVRMFARHHYVPDATTLIVQSPLPTSEQRVLVERVFGGLRGPSAPPKSPDEGGINPRPSGLREYSAAVAAPVIWIGWSLPGVVDQPKGMGTLLEHFVQWAAQDRGRPRDHDIARIDTHYIPGVRASLLALEVSLKNGDAPGRTGQSAIKHTLGALSEITHFGFEADRFNLASSVAYQQEGLLAHGLALACAAATFQDPGRVRQLAADVLALEESNFSDYTAKHLTEALAHMVLVRPLSAKASPEESKAAPVGQTEQRHREKWPAPHMARLGDWMRRADSRAYRTRTLANGLRVVIVPRAKSPFHTALLGFHGGGSYGVRGAGLASLWSRRSHAAPYQQGLESRSVLSADSLARGLRAVGRDLPTTLSILRDSIMGFDVRWPPQAFLNQIERFEREEQIPERRLESASRKALLGTHAYAAVITTTVEDMRSVTSTDVLEWLTNVERPENAELVIVGDFEANGAFRMVEDALGDWDGGKPATVSVPAPPALGEVASRGSQMIIEHAPSALQPKVKVACLVPPASADDWASYDVFRQVLASRLFDELRTQIGASYSVHGSVEFLRGGTTLLHISADVDPLRLQAAFHKIRGFLGNEAARSIDEESIEQARFSVGARYNLGLDTSMQAAQRVLLAWRLDWPLEAVTRYPERLLRVRREQVLRIAEHCRANAVVSVLGDAPTIRAAWSKADGTHADHGVQY